MEQLHLGLPKGSLQDATIELMRKAGWRVTTSSRSYAPEIDDPTIRCNFVRAQEIARYVESGGLEAGVTGSDWVAENGADVNVVADLVYAKDTFRPVRWVLAVPEGSDIQRVEDMGGKSIATEIVDVTERFFADRGIAVDVEFSWGATEIKAAEGLVDAIVELTETGSTLRANRLRIVDTIMTSNPQLIANRAAYAQPAKRAKIDQIGLLLRGALHAEARVGLKMNLPRDRLDAVIEMLPSITAPTVADLYGAEWLSVEIVVEERTVRELIPRLIEVGAAGIIEYPLNKIV